MKIQVIVTNEELIEMDLSMDSLEELILERLEPALFGVELVGFDVEMMEKM